MKCKKKLLRELPKTEIHRHLDGSVRFETIVDLAFLICSARRIRSRKSSATFTRLSRLSNIITAIMNKAVITVATTGVFNLMFTLAKKAGRRLSLAMASGFLEEASKPALPVVIKEANLAPGIVWPAGVQERGPVGAVSGLRARINCLFSRFVRVL